ncbi:MAG: hypothetical protein OXH15_21640 [Gammaproteobacteria bacterium]|nr:hypothetical protein [Gammaproteobacteria bacterium]
MSEQAETAKVDFAGAAWVDAARGVLEELVAEHCDDDTRLSVCEVFTDVPAKVAPSGTAAWYFFINGRSVTVGTGEVDDTDVKIRADYETALPGARTVYTPEIVAELSSRPPPDVQGDTSIFPAWLVELHNKMALITA